MSMFDGTPPQRGPSRVRPHSNLAVLRIAVVVLFGVLAVRLGEMQIIKGDEYATRARENHIQSQQILPARGLIYDANGTPLVENVGRYTAVIVPELLPDPDLDDEAQTRRREMYLYLEKLLGVPALETQARVDQAVAMGNENQAVPVKRHLDKEEALALSEVAPDMAGVSVEVEPARQYIGGESFSHLLGYVGPITAEEWVALQHEGYQFNQPVGKAGIEAAYERELRGKVGWSSNEITAMGDIVNVLETEEPEPGNSLKLSVDANLQERVTELLRDSMDGANNAAAVVTDVNTGAVKAMVSIPTWDNNIFSAPSEREDDYEALLEDPRNPLINRVTNPEAPGSTFKLVTAAAALQTGTITPSTGYTVDSMVKEFVGENGEVYPYYDWAVHGYVDLHSAIARSSNIYFYMASCGFQDEGIEGLGSNVEDSAYELRYYARGFGFGRETGIDLGDEGTGIIPDPQWKEQSRSDRNIFAPAEAEWYHADTCFMGIGQGDVTATPLQVNRMTAAIANGGRLMQPRLVWEVLDPSGQTVHEFEPEWEDIPVDPGHLEDLRTGMELSVSMDWGAGHQAFRPGMNIAGKTGTAEFTDVYGNLKEHAWFTGYYPAHDPQVAVTVYFDLGVGGNKAAPVAARILEYYDEGLEDQVQTP